MNFPEPPLEQAGASDAEVAASIGLAMLPGVGPRTICRWLELVGSAEAAWWRLPTLIGSRASAGEVLAAWRSLAPEAILARARDLGLTVLTCRGERYPKSLRTISDPPIVLFVRGELGDEPAVAIVGTRRATPYGRAAAERLAADLALAGVCVVSGLARGIDGVAHQAALDAGGRTIAVLGCGLDRVYPREHQRLAAAIAAHGALVSEHPPGAPPLPHHFPRRNRLISGLAAGVVVVEGAEDSGALVTVDCALDQGREVFAVPGSIFSPKSRAPHHLLRQGARLVEGAADVLEELGWSGAARRGVAASSSGPASEANGPRLADHEAHVLALLASGPRPLDDLMDASALPPARVAALVTVLELRGLIRMLPGQMVMRTTRRP
jgi:DNA processing protein